MTRAVGRSSSRPFLWAIAAGSLLGSSCNLSEQSPDAVGDSVVGTVVGTAIEPGDGHSADSTADIAANRVVYGSYIWQVMPVGAGGFVTGIVATGGPSAAMYARTDAGGAYRWEPTTQSWTQLLDARSLPGAFPGDTLSVDSIAVAPSLGTRVYLALGNDENPAPDTAVSGAGRILVSDDSGSTWRTTERRWFISGNQRFRTGSERLVVDPANPDHVLFGSSREGLFQSFDAGTTWTQIPLATLPAGIIDDPASDQPGVSAVGFVGTTIVAAVAGNGIFTSDDDGVSWTLIRPFDPSQFGSSAVEAAGDFWLSINRTDGNPAVVAVFDFDTATWTDLPMPTGSPTAVFAVDPTDPSHVVLTNDAVLDAHFWTSRDGGQNWTTHDIEISSPQIPWLANTDLDGYMSVGRVMFDPADGSLWFAEGMAIWRTTDTDAATITWTSVSRGIEETVASGMLAPPGGTPIGLVADRQGFLFDDTTRYPDRTLIDETFVGGTSADYSAGYPETIAWVGAEYHIYYSDERRPRGAVSSDGGVTWQQFEGMTPEMFGGEIAVSAVDPAILVWLPTHYTDPWAYSRNPVGLYYSHDSGQSWTHLDSVAGIDSFHRFMWWFNRRALAADRVNGNFYLMSDEGRFFTSSDGAASWQEAANAPPCLNANACHVYGQLHAQPDRAERLWAGVGIDGLYRSDDAGRSAWTKLPGVDEVNAMSFGAPLVAGGPAAVFLYGRANGDTQPGIYRSDDDGNSWQLITIFPAGSYTGISAISGDPDIPGRVYIAFSGTGFAQGDPIGAP